jgi:hypothetical protein
MSAKCQKRTLAVPVKEPSTASKADIPALPKEAEHWSLTSLRQKLVKIRARIIGHGRYVTFQMAEVVVPRGLFDEILRLIAQLRAPPAPA